MADAIGQELNKYINQLNAAQKKSLLGFIKTIFVSNEDETAATTIEEYNKELDEADAAISRGEFYTNGEVFGITKKMISARK